MLTIRKSIGNCGEQIARDYLVRNGYVIVANNSKIGQKELDIVTTHADTTVFIEVKTCILKTNMFSDEPLTRRQIKIIKKAIAMFCYQNHLRQAATRFDYISIGLSRKSMTAKIRHYKDIC